MKGTSLNLVFPECKTVPIEINIPVRHDISNDSNVENPKYLNKIKRFGFSVND